MESWSALDMAMQDDVVGRLARLGLPDAWGRAFVVLVQHPSDSDELTAQLGGSREEAEQILEALLHEGLIRRLPGKRKRYAASAPRASLLPYVRQRQVEIEAAERAIEELSQVQQRVQGSAAEEYVEVVFGARSVLAQAEELHDTATQEVVGTSRAPILSPGNPGEERALRRGVRYRWLWDRDLLEQPQILDRIRGYIDIGEEVRIAANLPSKLVIVDRRVAAIQVTESSGSDTRVAGLLTKHPELVATLQQLFDVLWDWSPPLVPKDETEATTDDPQRQVLIDCLIAGLSDAAMARQLGVSRRTLTRRLRELLDELGVQTRFQAGMKLATERQLTPTPGATDGSPSQSGS